MTDWAELYREHVAALAALAQGLDEAERAATVPGTPQWSVRDVYAHLAGVAADNVTGRTDGAPEPAWTARHVAERRGVALEGLVTELEAHQDAVSALAAENPGLVFDVATHHADLHEALGRHRLPEELWRPVLDRVAPRRVPELVDRVAPYELFRALFSRRSRRQLRAWDTGLSEAELDAIGFFGPREDDQPIPA